MNFLEQIPPYERRDLLIAWLALSLAFTLAMVWGSQFYLQIIVLYFIISLFTAGIAFLLHEMAHKFTAMKYGYWAEFQMSSMMLVVAVAMAAIAGIVFAAPGATVIYSNGREISKEENGVISLAGPLSNLILLIPFAGILLISMQSPEIGLLGIFGIIGIKINAMIAAFNLLPIGPLDGKKILNWNAGIFIIMAVAAFGILFASLYYL